MEISDIKQKAISGSKWSVIEKFALQLVQFVVGIVLARLLGPKAFGLIALTSIFLVISGAIMDGGFEKALIQNKFLSDLQVTTAFYINILLGVLLAIVICLFAPSIARYFDAPELTNILRVMSLGLPINAFGQTQRMLLMKELNFKKISVAQIFSAVMSGLVGITLAFCGFGVWALVYSSLVSTLTMVLIFWYKSPWYPRLKFSYASIAPVVPFGLNVLASGVLFFFLQQFNNFIVGKYYSKTELGLFSRGMKFPELVASVIQGVVLKISFPLFSKLQDDETHLKSVVRKSNRTVAFIMFPLLAFLFLDARQIIVLLLTDEWIGAVVFLKVFCLVKLFEPFISIQRELLLAKGRAKLLFRLFILTSVIEVVPILFLVKYDIMYVVWATLFSKVFQYFLYQFIASGRMRISVSESVGWILPYFLIIIGAGGIVYALDFFVLDPLHTGILLHLIIDAACGLGLYATALLMFRMEEVDTLKIVARSIFNFRKS